MGLQSIQGEKLIKLKGFNINGEILLSDSESIGNYEKVTVLLEPNYLVTDNHILDKTDLEYTIWGDKNE